VIYSPYLNEAAAWGLTYFAHSTLLIAAAWLAVKLVPAERLRLKERLWKTALVAGIVTASLQRGLDLTPSAGRVEWQQNAVALEAPAPDAVRVLGAAADWDLAAAEFTWERLLVGVWVLGGLAGLALFLFAWRRITDRLAGRHTVRSGPARDCLERLAARAGLRRVPRLSISSQLKSPATVGVFLPQICVPARALSDLAPAQQEALIAHELAHILRRDPLWFFVCGVIERLFFFQPLNRVARKDLQEIAEFLADDWAAQNTGSELGLARCLTEVATWVLDLRPVVAVVPMASVNSRLAARIGRLLDPERRPQDHSNPRRALVLPALTLGFGALCLPGAAALEAAPANASAPKSSSALVGRPLAAVATPGLSAPNAAPAPVSLAPPLESALVDLDAEVDALFDELGALQDNFDAQRRPSRRRTQAMAELGHRVRRLRERRERLRELLPQLLEPGADNDITNSTPTELPEQETSR